MSLDEYFVDYDFERLNLAWQFTISNFLNTDISQGSVGTCLRCGEIFTDHFTANLLMNLSCHENGSRCDSYYCEHGVFRFSNSVSFLQVE